ncbi:hypothetical protein GO613_12745 [Azoarcus communis]|uniref:hypothetical protein n=1 Tax=Parazoarcus communis TaxID=41977 RepID=UPI001459AF2B|nr:hypothetical protein [Parazoarcus communis]NMG48969.1 hypothetical protein [Parazoarcus communis]
MTRGRKPTATPDIIEPDLDQGRIDNAVEVMRKEELGAIALGVEREQNVRAAAMQVGYLLPADCIDPDLIQRDISANMRRSVEACLEVGRGLVVLKAACEHGQFMARLDVLGIDSKVAARFMQSARKFSNVATSRHLIDAIGSQSKLFELLVLDDDQVEELELTGQTGELSLDDIATMSVKELRAALREARADGQAKDELLADKNRLLDTERAKSKRIATLPPDDVLADLHKEATAIANDARGAIIGQLRQAVAATQSHHELNGGDSRVFLGGLVGQLMADLANLRAEFDLPVVDNDDHGWINQE